METSVVIATRDRRASLLRTLARLLELPERPPVLVVDNASRDGTPVAVRSRFHGVVELVAAGANLGAAGRTLGVERARTPYVAFSDDDSWWEPGALTRAAELLAAHPEVAVVAARIHVVPDGGALDPTCAEMARSPLPAEGLPGPAVLGFVACGAVVRRRAYLDAGGFDARLHFGGEESHLAIELARRGWRLVYADDVVAYHDPSPARDVGARRHLEARNALWTAWLRRPAPTALGATMRGLRTPLALAAALGGLPWIARERRPVPRELEAQLRLIDERPRGARSVSRRARRSRSRAP